MFYYQRMPGEPVYPMQAPETELRMVDGRLCECIPGREGATVSRLISTDPMDYLNPAFAPGRLVLDRMKEYRHER